jgi:hypothetical protein
MALITLPAKAISLKQPWGWLMVNGYKTVENRNWQSGFRGPVLVHASQGWDAEAFPIRPDGQFLYQHLKLPFPKEMPKFVQDYDGLRGGIVGQFTIVDCVTASQDPWFFGRYGFVVEEAKPLPFVACRGLPSFFPVEEGVRQQLIRKLAEQTTAVSQEP